MPINVKSDNVFVEFIFRRAIPYNETGMNHTPADFRAYTEPATPQL